MNVKLGNVAPKESYYPYEPKDRQAELAAKSDSEVLAEAKAKGVTVDDADVVGIEMIRARLDAVVAFRPLQGNRVTEISPGPGSTMATVFTEITHPNGIWAHWSDAPPAWVESDSDGIAALLSEHFGCPIGRPDDWDGLEVANAGLAVGEHASDPSTVTAPPELTPEEDGE